MKNLNPKHRNAEITETFPAYDVVRLQPQSNITTLYAEDELQIKGKYSHYQINSVVSSSLKDGRDPLECVERAKGFGHQLHFIFPLACCISSSQGPREVYIEVEYGMVIKFEGKLFVIEKAANDNLKLVEA